MTLPFIIGLMGSLVLVAGAAYPIEKTKIPYKSVKNRLFAIGGLIMLAYALLGYFTGGPIFFVILEILVTISCILMMLNTNDRFDTAALGISGVALVIRSLSLFE